MRRNVNNNFLWANTFINQLAALGVRYACISPGSRSTPLTYSIATNKKIKSFINIDERSSAFFALGLAKASATPVIIVTTSGTAAAEVYPAVIEAYQQRTPLIICTADRPPELLGTGANQTINQYNLYRNHIRWFRDAGLPNVKEHSLRYLQKVAVKAFRISLKTDKGPVHINFPFKKPLEPFSHTEEVNSKIINLKPISNKTNGHRENADRAELKKVKRIAEKIINLERGIIIVGPGDFNKDLFKKIFTLSSITKYPVIADGTSHLRFITSRVQSNVISFYHSFISSGNFCKKYNAELILHFGQTPTSSNLLEYLAGCNAERFQVNEFGDLHDPSKKTGIILNASGEIIAQNLVVLLSKKNFHRNKTSWLEAFKSADSIAGRTASGILNKGAVLTEPQIVSGLIKYLPAKSHLFLGNSMPIRDFDSFSGTAGKTCYLYFNRGASGIDGVVSTAAGVSAINQRVFLLVGDLSFLHDLNSLIISKNNFLPLTVILINNNGGGIFRTLPVSGLKKLQRDFFITPHNLSIAEIVKAFGIRYRRIKNKEDMKIALTMPKPKLPEVLEIQTNADQSVKFRKQLFNKIKTEVEKFFTG